LDFTRVIASGLLAARAEDGGAPEPPSAAERVQP
jgi:hypothetical protein